MFVVVFSRREVSEKCSDALNRAREIEVFIPSCFMIISFGQAIQIQYDFTLYLCDGCHQLQKGED